MRKTGALSILKTAAGHYMKSMIIPVTTGITFPVACGNHIAGLHAAVK